MRLLSSPGHVDLRELERKYLTWRGFKHISSDRAAYLSLLALVAMHMWTSTTWTALLAAGACASIASLSTGLGLLLYCPSTYAQYREIIVATQFYILPLVLLDKHQFLERGRVRLLGSTLRGIGIMLFFKWPPYLLLTRAFPVVAVWAPYVQLISLLMLNVGTVHALLVYGNELLASPGVMPTCKLIDTVLTGRLGLLTVLRRLSGACPYLLPARVAAAGGALPCRRYIFGMWIMGQVAVFWLTLFEHAGSERKQRAQFLASLGVPGPVTWPLFRDMVVRVVGVQLLVALFFVLFLEDLLEGLNLVTF
eukprot:jgi/Botrbrau1/15185/Bobra.0149s0050.1